MSVYELSVIDFKFYRRNNRMKIIMNKIIVYGKKISSVFWLIGTLENDIIRSIAWVLYNCSVFLTDIIKKMARADIDSSKVRIKYKDFKQNKRTTNLEVTDDDWSNIIIEAKRGWILRGES